MTTWVGNLGSKSLTARAVMLALAVLLVLVPVGLMAVCLGGGMALVAFVFAAVLMLDAGLKQTMVGTGSLDNVVSGVEGVYIYMK
jgi:hypothetical protein